MKWSKQKAQDLQALMAGGSTVKDACEKIGIDRTTFYLWKELHPEWAADVQQVRETLLDDVEDAIYTKAKAGDVTACIFILKTQGRKRGWIEKIDVDAKVTNQNQYEGWSTEDLLAARALIDRNNAKE